MSISASENALQCTELQETIRSGSNLKKGELHIMNIKAKDIDMLNGPLTGKLLLFTLPIALSSILQQLFSAADTAVVGCFGNADALAAVGTNTEIVALIVTVSSGLSIGANVLAASHIGKNKKEDMPKIAQNAMIMALAVGIIGLIVGLLAANSVLQMINTPENILYDAGMYLKIYMLGYPFLLLYDFGAALLRSKGDSRYPFIILMMAGIVNVILNIIFVAVFHLGVAGVSISTGISNIISAVFVIRRLYKDDLFRLSVKRVHISGKYIAGILKIGVPSAVQGAMFCFANIFVQASVNTFGELTIAGSTIAVNFEYIVYYVITAFAQTTTTFISQNYAAVQLKRCRKILAKCMVMSIIFSAAMIGLIVIFRELVSGLFSSDPLVIENACVRIMCVLIFESICSVFEIPAGVLKGTGHATLPAVGTIIGICAFRIIWICTIFKSNPMPEMLYHAFPLSWVFTIILILAGYFIVRPLREKVAE